jgi:hypothetical protein
VPPLFRRTPEIADKRIGGHVVSRDHHIVKGLTADGQAVGVACNPDGKPLPGAELVVLDPSLFPRLGPLVARFRNGGRS